MRRPRHLLLVICTLLPLGAYLACSDDSATAGPGGVDGSAPETGLPTKPDGAPATGDDDDDDAGIVTNDSGIVIAANIDFDPNGNGDPTSLVWDDANKALFIADNKNNQIWKWTDATGLFKSLTLPNTSSPDAATDVGQIAELADGTLVVPRFGFGINGGIAFINPSTSAGGEVPSLDPVKRRVGLTAAGDGTTMYGSYFLMANSMDDAGTVTQVTETGETLFAGGFQKPVATLVLGKMLVVSDQNRSILYGLPTDGGAVAPYAIWANVASPDTIIAGPNGTVIAGQFRVLADGGTLQLRQISADGTKVNVILGDQVFTKPKGLAYDKANQRLFVADSNGTTIRKLRIFHLE